MMKSLHVITAAIVLSFSTPLFADGGSEMFRDIRQAIQDRDAHMKQDKPTNYVGKQCPEDKHSHRTAALRDKQ